MPKNKIAIREADKHQTHNPDRSTTRRLLDIKMRKMLADYVQGRSITDLAKKYDVSISTAKRYLTTAAGKDGGKLIHEIERLERDVIQDLVPKALEIYSKKLDEGDPYVAKDVLDKLIKIGQRLTSKEQHQQTLTVDSYFKAKRLENETDNKTSRSAGDVIEAPRVEEIFRPEDGAGTDETVGEIFNFGGPEESAESEIAERLRDTEDEDQQ